MTRVLTRAKRGSIGEFSRHTPCTFLVNGCCSVYEARSFVCRNQLALDVDALLCQPENIELMAHKHPLATDVPMMTGGPMTEVYRDLVAQDVLADIRAFFPSGTDTQAV
ncbi:hypothetical protein PQR05_37575 [Paraburkholderia sediminicola]|uniref:hypothetical protein n=1 Tax=Paraburkholderia sediminicola TaxID=458836 RepID=UPI0038B88B79